MAWDSYSEGMVSAWDFTFSSEDMLAFEKMSKDHNPIHTNPEFAQSKGFSGPLVYGLLLATQVSRLVGQELPDTHAILTGLSLNFTSPAFVDEQLRFESTLVNKSDATYSLGFKCRITRGGKSLCRGTASAVWRS